MDKKQAIFNENDIPYKELELIGISKKQIWSLDKANITALLSGKRTSLLDPVSYTHLDVYKRQPLKLVWLPV